MSLRGVLNAIDLLLGMSFVDLSRMKGVVSKIGQKYFLFWADLAKFTKNAQTTVEFYLRRLIVLFIRSEISVQRQYIKIWTVYKFIDLQVCK